MSLEQPQRRPAWAGFLSIAVLLSTASAAAAADGQEEAPPAALPADRGAEAPWWTAAFQSTYVWQRKPSFAAPYSGPKSLEPAAENGYTLTATVFLGVRAWPGAELFVNPEVIQSQELSHLSGLAGLSNGEAQKSGGPEATLYRARAFLRQTIPLGGEEATSEPGANQLGGRTASRRLVLTAGNFSVADVFDGNAYAHDPRTQFLNWSLMAYGASDYAADVRGYTWGLALELYLDEWALRVGRFAQPKESNGLDLDPDLLAHHGDSLELEHAHELFGRRGKVRVAGFRNFARMGSFSDALALAAASGGAPNVADVRRDRAKVGFGAALEQQLSRDVGVFARYSWNDGRTETYAFTEIERSVMGGVSVRGTRWRRERDTVGVALVQNALSSAHRRYVEAGGAGLFLGDGGLRYRPERILEAYYSLQASPGLWFSLDAQRIENPAYNADRGPVNVLGCRFHVEY
jgi:high affinity Mn2+ porin